MKQILGQSPISGKKLHGLILATFFIPSVFLWTSVGLRESFIIAEITLFLAGLNFLFQEKSTANSQEIKDLKPYGKDVGPLMGAIIEVDGQTYKIEKQWLKDKKTEVELLAPEKKALSGNAADKVIDEIFTEYLDETIWKMIQVL